MINNVIRGKQYKNFDYLMSILAEQRLDELLRAAEEVIVTFKNVDESVENIENQEIYLSSIRS